MEKELNRAELLKKMFQAVTTGAMKVAEKNLGNIPGFVIKSGFASGGEKQDTAYIKKNLCLAHKNTLCRYCSDACPESAINFENFRNPVINIEKCSRCGECVPVCIAAAVVIPFEDNKLR